MNIFEELNPMQAKAVSITEGPMLILAGAGSGKTRTIIYRIANILLKGLASPCEILAVTFTKKASEEMKNRIAAFGISGTDALWCGTFHAMCSRILRMHACALGISDTYTIYDEADTKAVLKKCYARLSIDEGRMSLMMARAAIAKAKENYVDQKHFANHFLGVYGFYTDRLSDIYTAYEEILRENNALDFDDLIFLCVKLFKEHPDILRLYQQQFKYILVDEYQDTNHLQFLLVSMLASLHENICVCGDDDQSIYSFRGANIQNILDFEKDFPGCVVVRLEQNYRSTTQILDCANTLIANNEERKGKTLYSSDKNGEKPMVICASNEKHEAKIICDLIDKLRSEARVRYADIAILYRMNAQSRVLEESLLTHDIPYSIYGGTRFYDRAEVKDLLAYLKLIVNEYDTVSFERCVNTPKRGLGQGARQKIEEYASFKSISLMGAALQAQSIITLQKKARDRLEEFASLIEAARLLRGDVEKCMEYIVKSTHYIEMLKDRYDVESESKIQNIYELLGACKEFARGAEDGGVSAFLENIALIGAMDAYDPRDGKVVLMTLHNSKGLEYDNVFIAGMEEMTLPSYRSVEEGSVEEERRLCYVGMTRAKKRLYLSYCQVKTTNGMTRPMCKSRFLGELAEDQVEMYAGEGEDFADSVYSSAFQSRMKRRYTQRASSSASSYPGAPAGRPHYAKQHTSYVSPQTSKSASAAMSSFRVGRKVSHPTFGTGTIVLTENKGASIYVSVAFENLGIKKLDASVAKLKLL